MLNKSGKEKALIAVLAVFQTLQLQIVTHPKDILKLYFIGSVYRLQGFSDLTKQLKFQKHNPKEDPDNPVQKHCITQPIGLPRSDCNTSLSQG